MARLMGVGVYGRVARFVHLVIYAYVARYALLVVSCRMAILRDVVVYPMTDLFSILGCCSSLERFPSLSVYLGLAH